MALIEWERLSLKDWRGNLTSYEIVYYDMLDEQCPLYSLFKNMSISVEEKNQIYITESTVLSVVEGNIQVNITGLEAVVQYCVSVAAKTSTGIGEFSYSVIPSKYLFMLVINHCLQGVMAFHYNYIGHTDGIFSLSLMGVDSCSQWIVSYVYNYI